MLTSMNGFYIVYSVFVLFFVFNGCFAVRAYVEPNCGKDMTKLDDVVYEGVAKVENYPWLGYLYYRNRDKRFFAAILLITKQMALGTALDIDKFPKHDFRARARAVFGSNCSGPSIPIRDYSFHKDYEKATYSSLAMIQLETDYNSITLHPICEPPSHLDGSNYYVLKLSSDSCKKPTVTLYDVDIVDNKECRSYYRDNDLDVKSIWPTSMICVRAMNSRKRCVWQGGAVLATKMGGRWRLLGYGVFGPGCGGVARFVDYGAHYRWARRNVYDIGKPTISRVRPNVMVLRRSLSNLQRYGPCDLEESKYEIFTDHTVMTTQSNQWRTARYNLSLYAGVEYSCVVFRVDNFNKRDLEPKIFLRRWCAGAVRTCKDFQYIEIEFFVEIKYYHSVTYDVKAYGREAKAIDVTKARAYIGRTKGSAVWSLAKVVDYMYKRHFNVTSEKEIFYSKNSRFKWFNLRLFREHYTRMVYNYYIKGEPMFKDVDYYTNYQPYGFGYIYGWDFKEGEGDGKGTFVYNRHTGLGSSGHNMTPVKLFSIIIRNWGREWYPNQYSGLDRPYD